MPVAAVSKMTAAALSRALSFGDEVTAVSVELDDEGAASLQEAWDRWQPGVQLTILRSASRSITKPMLASPASPRLPRLASPQLQARLSVLVLVPEVEPTKWRHQLLQRQRGIILANGLRRRSDVHVARVPFRLRNE